MKPVIVGDPHKFAIESCIKSAYAGLGIRALGFFLIHVGGYSYGVRSQDATMLACSFDEVEQRILRRGSHTVPFSNEPNAASIASAVYDAIYAPEDKVGQLLGISVPQLSKLIYAHHVQWAPDGDEAFDDGSRVLHFDVDHRVRIIAYTLELSNDKRYRPNPLTLRDQWVEADEFYSVLQRWRDTFEAEWLAAPKVPEVG